MRDITSNLTNVPTIVMVHNAKLFGHMFGGNTNFYKYIKAGG